jgi:hypothetical protein
LAHKLGSAEAEALRQRPLHVPGINKVDMFGEGSERIFVEFSYSRARQGNHATCPLRVIPRQLCDARGCPFLGRSGIASSLVSRAPLRNSLAVIRGRRANRSSPSASASLTPLTQAISISSRRSIASRPSLLSKQLLAHAVFHRQVKEQVAMHGIRLHSRLALGRPYSGKFNLRRASPVECGKAGYPAHPLCLNRNTLSNRHKTQPRALAMH